MLQPYFSDLPASQHRGGPDEGGTTGAVAAGQWEAAATGPPADEAAADRAQGSYLLPDGLHAGHPRRVSRWVFDCIAIIASV